MSRPIQLLLLTETADWGASVQAAIGEAGGSLDVDVETDPGAVERAIAAGRVDALLVDDTADVDLNGLLETLRAVEPGLPVLLCVPKSSETAVRRGIEAGVTDFLERERVAEGSDIAIHRLMRLGGRSDADTNNTADTSTSTETSTRTAAEASAGDVDGANRVIDDDDTTTAGGDNAAGTTTSHRDRSVFITHSPLGFIEWDPAFRIVGVNPATESILGYEAETLHGRSWRTLLPERTHEAVAACIEELRETAGHTEKTLPIRRADGTERLCDCHIRVVADEDGDVSAAFTQFRDVTKQRETERQLAQYASTLTKLQRTAETLLGASTPAEAADIVVDSLTEVFEFDIAGVWLATDDRTALEPVSMTEPGRQLIEEPPTYSAASPSLSWRAFTEGTSRLIEDMHAETERYNPETPIRSELVVPLGEYGVLNIGSQTPGGFSRQDLHRLEGWAKTVTAALARIEQLTTLTERERELERERNRLDAFTSTVTHDLRNPLAVASGRLDLLAADCDSEHLEPIERALDRMEGLIEEMIELARQGEQVGETEWVDLDPFLDQCWQTVATAAATLSVETDAVVEADRSRLSGLFENLFRNAIDHVGEDVHITVGTLADGEGFYVADDGDGVAETEREQIFERGYSTRPRGTGYGLAIVNEIAEAHGWTVEVTDSDHGGARFEIRGVAVRED